MKRGKRINKIAWMFEALDSRLLDLQELLCATKLTHHADQIDILRRAVNTTFDLIIYERLVSETKFNLQMADVKRYQEHLDAFRDGVRKIQNLLKGVKS